MYTLSLKTHFSIRSPSTQIPLPLPKSTIIYYPSHQSIQQYLQLTNKSLTTKSHSNKHPININTTQKKNSLPQSKPSITIKTPYNSTLTTTYKINTSNIIIQPSTTSIPKKLSSF